MELSCSAQTFVAVPVMAAIPNSEDWSGRYVSLLRDAQVSVVEQQKCSSCQDSTPGSASKPNHLLHFLGASPPSPPPQQHPVSFINWAFALSSLSGEDSPKLSFAEIANLLQQPTGRFALNLIFIC